MPATKRGRPIEYDRDQALERATDVFWSAGFSASSLDALSEATKLTRPSLAGAFGDKQALYIATLERYRDLSIEGLSDALSGNRDLKTELADMFSRAADAYLAGDEARGCLLIGTASVEAVTRSTVRDMLRQSLAAFNAIIEGRLRKAIDTGELPTRADAAELASMISAVMHSMAVIARAGEPRSALDGLAETAIRLICSSSA